MKVRKRPTVVDAHQIPNPKVETDLKIFLSWCETVNFVSWSSSEGDEIEIKTVVGNVKARSGDWVIKNAEGDFWPVEKDTFDNTYDIIIEQPTVQQPTGLDFGATTSHIDMLDADYSGLNLEGRYEE